MNPFLKRKKKAHNVHGKRNYPGSTVILKIYLVVLRVNQNSGQKFFKRIKSDFLLSTPQNFRKSSDKLFLYILL